MHISHNITYFCIHMSLCRTVALCLITPCCSSISYHLSERHQLRQASVATRLAVISRPQLDILLEPYEAERRSVLESHDANFANQPDEEKNIAEYICLGRPSEIVYPS